jgi:hypothetical protein
MAVDTRDKRASAISIAQAFIWALPLPDGAIVGAGDRQHVAMSYRLADGVSGSGCECSVSTVVVKGGVLQEGVEGTLQLACRPQQDLCGRWVEVETIEAVSGVDGVITWTGAARGVKYILQVKAIDREAVITIPNAATYTV